MRQSVLIYEDEPLALAPMTNILERRGFSVFPARYLTDAADVLFSTHPPAVFIADLAVDLWINVSVYDEIRNNHHFESDTYGNTGALALVHDAQEQVHDVRIILNSGINGAESAKRLGVFGYVKKPIHDEAWNNLIEVCRLGTLRSDEFDISGRLKGGPFDMEASWSLKPYIDKFWATQRKEQK